MRVPLVGRCRPPVITRMPDFIISCVKAPMAAIFSGVGGATFGDCS